MNIPDYADILSAAERIRGQAVHTPLLESAFLNELTGARVFIKPESLQRTGSFKFRGAYNAISALSEPPGKGGIIAASSGNHAQGIAEASRLFGYKSTIVMPHDTPQIKVDRTRRSGADIVFYNRDTGSREGTTEEVVSKLGGVFIHPFEHPDVVAGQGTVGLEIADALERQEVAVDRVLVCTGGGGLTAGVALAIRERFPDAKIHPVEPEGFDDYKRSLESGGIVRNNQQGGSVCDAILTPAPGDLSFAINREILTEGLVISDDEALAAVRFAFNELKLVVEPGGAAALAGLLQAGKKWQGENIAIVISGGNIDPVILDRALNQ